MAYLTHWKRTLKRNLPGNPIVDKILSSATIEEYCRSVGHQWRESFWSPTITIITFLLQVLSAEKTLRAAVASLLTQLTIRGETDLPSADPTAYCQARIRLPGEVIAGMMNRVADRMRELVDRNNAWLGHRVWVVDGSNVSMPDTPQLQKAYPQPSGQKPGCGFPVAQFVALFCWTTGALIDVIIETIRPHELTLFRKLWSHFAPGDVVLADRAYGSYVDMARLLCRGIYCVFRLHQRRKTNFRKGQRLGPNDHLVTWTRPLQWLESFGVSKDEFEQLPEFLQVRELRISHAPKGFRSRTIIVVTTLLDPIEVPADEIRALYRDRWTAELNLRSLKTFLGMDVLRSQSPNVVHKEIAMHLLAYNIIRLLMWHAAREHGRDLHRLSFTGTLHRLRTILPTMMVQKYLCCRDELMVSLLAWIAHDKVPSRPNRIEPRRRKRRPKEYSLLNKPRRWYHTHKDIGVR